MEGVKQVLRYRKLNLEYKHLRQWKSEQNSGGKVSELPEQKSRGLSQTLITAGMPKHLKIQWWASDGPEASLRVGRCRRVSGGHGVCREAEISAIPSIRFTQEPSWRLGSRGLSLGHCHFCGIQYTFLSGLKAQ
jgi:hypothetical protein